MRYLPSTLEISIADNQLGLACYWRPSTDNVPAVTRLVLTITHPAPAYHSHLLSSFLYAPEIITMSLPRLLRTPCARSLTKSTLSPASLRLLPVYKTFSTSRARLEELTIDDDLHSKLPGIDPSRLEVTETITPKALVSNQDLVFGRTFTGEYHPPMSESRHTNECTQTTCSRSNGRPHKAGLPLE